MIISIELLQDLGLKVETEPQSLNCCHGKRQSNRKYLSPILDVWMHDQFWFVIDYIVNSQSNGSLSSILGMFADLACVIWSFKNEYNSKQSWQRNFTYEKLEIKVAPKPNFCTVSQIFFNELGWTINLVVSFIKMLVLDTQTHWLT